MRYIKIKSDETIVYPYTINNLFEEYPNTSFPEQITNEVLLEYNILPVIEISKGTDINKNYTEGIPVLINNQYYQNWILTNATEEEISERLQQQWFQIRSIRNTYLSESDWTQLPDSPLSEIKKQEWIIYRQSLRDVTNQEDPFNIEWPTKPV
jgi:hypothetical protein